jgi:hypothetical protein
MAVFKKDDLEFLIIDFVFSFFQKTVSEVSAIRVQNGLKII